MRNRRNYSQTKQYLEQISEIYFDFHFDRREKRQVYVPISYTTYYS